MSLFLVILLGAVPVVQTGTFSGKVVDAGTGQPLPGVNIVLVGTELGAATDEYGNYEIVDIPIGEYTVEASMLGYKPQALTRVGTLPARSVFLDFRLRPAPLQLPGVTVRPDYFTKGDDATTSEVELNYHEIRLNPEGYNIPRTVASLPGVATGYDFSSDIIVRGGDPDENLTVIDNLPVPYPVHFPAIGGGFGQASIVSVEGLDAFTFSPGGYSARFGDKLSSLMEISMRDGNKDKFEALADLNMSGVEAMLEGPIGPKFNYIAGYRRSFLEIVDLISDIGNVVPSFDDIYLRLAYSPTPRHKIWAFGIQTFDRMDIPPDAGGVGDIMWWRGHQTISGLNWKALLGSLGYSVLTLGGTDLVNDLTAADTVLDSNVYNFRPHETHLYIREAVSVTPFKGFQIEAGVFGGYSEGNYIYMYREFSDTGDLLYSAYDTTDGGWYNAGTYLQHVFTPLEWLKITPGVRAYYNTLTGELLAEPRAGLSLKPFQKTTFNLNFGIYHQLNDFRRHLNNDSLSSKRAIHGIVGIEQLLTDDMKVSLEYYYKYLDNLLYYDPVDSVYTNEGHGKSDGVELFLQKKMGKYLYGQAAYSLGFGKRWNPTDGTYPADWDTRHMLTLITGVKFLKNFEASVKFRYATGRPWTPYDTANAYFDPTDSLWYVERVSERNSGRLPAYSRLDFQLSYTSYTKSGVTISSFVNLQNVLNHSNVSGYGWDAEEGILVPSEGFKFMPVGGVVIKF